MSLTLGSKISLGFGALAGAILLGGGFAYGASGGLGAKLDELHDARLPAFAALSEMRESLGAIQSAERSLLQLHYDAAERRAAWPRMAATLRRMDAARARYERLPRTPEEERVWSRVVPAWERWRASHLAVEALAEQVDRAVGAGVPPGDPVVSALQQRAYRASSTAREPYESTEELLERLAEANLRGTAESRQSANELQASAGLAIIAGVLFCLVLAALMGAALRRNVAAILRSLMSESEKLTTAVLDGKTQVRGDVASINFEFRPVVQGMNDTMDAFSKPMGVMTEYVERIGQGDIPPKVTDAYRGDFDKMKTSLNRTIDAVRLMVTDSAALAKGAVEGKLENRADASCHQGDFARVISGINETLDAVIKPIEESGAVLALLASRDLRARVKGNYQGDHAQIKDSINTMADSLHAAITQVTATTEQLSAASEQIAASSQTVSQGTTEQASALEETSSTLEEIAAMTRQNADNTQQAKALAQATKVAADSGNVAMARMVESMGKIRAAAEGTAEIIRDINEIAFQTNLLALNAAVEAARAGDAGRGFAVVAEEVRNLALRSKDAAKKTEELIKQSVRLAEEGGTISHAVNGNLAGIVTSVGKVTDIVGEIAVASQEQARGVDQVNKAISQMEQVVQQSAANSEETSSSAAELSSQAQDLAALVGSFQLGDTAHGAVRGTAPKKALSPPRFAAAPTRRLAVKSHGNGHGAGNGHVQPRPEDLIPMDQDPDFREF